MRAGASPDRRLAAAGPPGARPTRQQIEAEHAASAARPWPSVESRRFHRPRNRHGRRPLYTSVDTATYRPAVTHRDTWRDKKEMARIAENPQLAGRFRRWWQVLGSNQRRLSRRFYS